MHKLCFDQICPLSFPTNSPYSSSLFSPPNVLFSFFFKTHRVHSVLPVLNGWGLPSGARVASISGGMSLEKTDSSSLGGHESPIAPWTEVRLYGFFPHP